jgi:branched-chain amino acid transport system ATP-binding protein
MLKLDGVYVYYGEIQAIKGVSFFIDEGEIVTLIGANGAGKTTILKTISGICKPRKGSITYNNQEISRLNPPSIVRLGISHAPEGRGIFPKMSVKENLEMGAYIRNDKGIEDDYELIFDHFPVLKERLNQMGGTLSGGEQQMLAIGRALMSRPKLLLLDEPSLGLAPMLVETIFNIIRDINKQGTTILLVEQNAYQALQIANRCYVIETGRIVMEGPAEEMMYNDHVKKAYLGEM